VIIEGVVPPVRETLPTTPDIIMKQKKKKTTDENKRGALKSQPLSSSFIAVLFFLTQFGRNPFRQRPLPYFKPVHLTAFQTKYNKTLKMKA
jgi:hypothetical protein